MPFSDIVGHRRQVENLRRALAKGRLHHAYLFLGPEGIGKRTVAVSLAMAIHCLEKTHDFCGSCTNCLRIRNGNHPDVRMVVPAPGKKEISIQQIRELESELNLRAFSGKKKLAIVDPASLMNLAAQNALLKTLEEPPGDSLLILISPSIGGLLPTVLSRCLRVTFGPLPIDEMTEYLTQKNNMQREEARLLSALTMGSLGRALTAEFTPAEKRRAWIEKIASLERSDVRGWLSLAEELASDPEECIKFLDWVECWYRDVLIYTVTGSGREITNLDMLEEIKKAARLSLEGLLSLLSQAARTKARLRHNINRRMALESFLQSVARSD